MILVGNFIRNGIDVLTFVPVLRLIQDNLQKLIFGAIWDPSPPEIGYLTSESWGIFYGTAEDLTESKKTKIGRLIIFS